MLDFNRRSLRAARAALVVLLATMALAAPAQADSASCVYGGGVATVTVTPSDDFAPMVFRDGAGEIRIGDSDGSSDCGAATVTNTDTINVRSGAPSVPLVGPFYIGFRQPLAPGATDEPGSSDEIEFDVDLGAGGSLALQVSYSTSDPAVPFDVAIGANQINLNAGEADGVDADVTMTGVTEIQTYPGAFDDRIVASGGAGTPAEPTPIPLFAAGGFGGNDLIVGGSGNDQLFGVDGDDQVDGGAGDDLVDGEALTHPTPAGNDILIGGPGDDALNGFEGADFIDGGPGRDRVNGDDFHFPTAGSADVLLGGDGDDIIAGHGGDDAGSGGAGRDQFLGGPGNENAAGGPGRDKVKGEDGDDTVKGNGGGDRLGGGPGNDAHKGGPGEDRCQGGPGSNTFSSCEHHSG